jgi:hypothetical protein
MKENVSSPNVLERIERTIERRVHITKEERLGISLWILHTYIHKRYIYTPRLALLSPWYGHGKSTMLDVLERLTFNSFKSNGATPAVIFRVIGNSSVTTTMLLDEGDNQNLRLDREYRKVLNSNRRGDWIDRMSGKQVMRFNVFAPIAIAAVHDLYSALMQRSVIIYILQPPPEVKLEDLPQQPDHPDYIKFVQETSELQADIEQWAESVILADNPPNPLRIRLKDNWRGLFAIADSLGRGDDAREAATELVKGYPMDNPGVNLLMDIWEVFDDIQTDRCFTKKMIEYLHRKGWDVWTGLDGEMTPHALNERELPNILRRFKIHPTMMQPLGPRTMRSRGARGYYRKDFEYAWSVYCPQLTATPQHRNTSTEESTIIELEPKKPPKKRRFKISEA